MPEYHLTSFRTQAGRDCPLYSSQFKLSIVITFLSIISTTTVCVPTLPFSPLHTQIQRIILLPLPGLTWEGLHMRMLILQLHTPYLSLHWWLFKKKKKRKNPSCGLSVLQSSVIGQKTGRRRKRKVLVMICKAPPLPSTLCSALYIHRQHQM